MHKIITALLLLIMLASVAAAQDKSIVEEPSFIVSESLKWSEVAISEKYVDGIRLKEWNRLLAHRDGSFNLPAAFVINGAQTGATIWFYKRNPRWAKRIMWGVAAFKGFVIVRTFYLKGQEVKR